MAAVAAALLSTLQPGAVRAASLTVEGGAIVLGETQSSTVLLAVDEPPGTEGLPLRVAVNVGHLSEPVRLGPGRYRATYVPPATRFPQVATAAVWRETGPDAPIDFLPIPLRGITQVRVAAPPRAEVRARVGTALSGPVTADRSGRAEVPIRAEPGDRECAVIIRDAGGGEVTRSLPLQLPAYNRLAAALVPHAVVGDGRSAVRLAVHYDAGGADVAPERIRVTPSAGTVTFERSGGGVTTYRYVPPPGLAEPGVTFRVSVAGDPAAEASAQLTLGIPPPATVIVTGPQARLRAGSGAAVAVTALVLDAAGMGLSGLEVTATARGRTLPPPLDRGGGLYELALAAPEAYPPGGVLPVRVWASSGPATAEGSLDLQLEAPPVPATISARFVPRLVPADGATEAKLLVEVRDGAGMPVNHVQLVSVATHGIVGSPTERGNGVYEHTYQSPGALPDGDAQLRVSDATGSIERRFPIPLRPAPHALLVGAGAGYTQAPGDASGPRALVEAWVPFGGPEVELGAGLQVGFGRATKTVSNGALSSRSEATFVPMALKVGWAAYSGRRFSVTLGAGLAAAVAEFRTSLSGEVARGFGVGWLGFTDLGWSLGPGQVVLGLSVGAVPVQTPDARIDPGGLSAALGYRLGVP